MLTQLCLPIRLSVTRRYCVETAKHIIKLFSLLHSQTVVVFPLTYLLTKRYGNIPTLTIYDSVDGRTQRDMKKQFSTNISLYLGNDAGYYGM